MAQAGDRLPEAAPHPLRPKRSILTGYAFPHTRMFVIGDYEVNCGGCDKYSWKGSADWVEDLIYRKAAEGFNVVFEGVLVSQWRTERFLHLNKASPFQAILLSTPIGDCIEAINTRRMEKGNKQPVDPKTTTDKYHHNLRKFQADLAAGLKIYEMDRDAAYLACTQTLGLNQT
jgi:hypothetical protein